MLCALLLAALAIGAALAGGRGTQIAQARPLDTTIVVTNTNDSSAFSLRQAITDANSAGGVNTITFDLPGCPCVINLLSALPQITRPLTILGPGASMLAISGKDQTQPVVLQYRVLDIVGVPATIQDLTIQNGGTSVSAGGGIRSNNALTLTNVTVSGNRADYEGGGVFANSLTAVNAQFLNNRAQTGGGFYVQSSILSNTSVMTNVAANLGAGAYSKNVTAINSRFIDNQICCNAAAAGGGLFASGQVLLTSTKFISNVAGTGGALYAYDASMSIVDSDFRYNIADHGGALDVGFDNASIENTRFIGNEANLGSVIYGAGNLRIVNTLFTGSSSSSTLQLFGEGNWQVLHCTFAEVVSGTGTAMLSGQGGRIGIVNTIIASYAVGIITNGGTADEGRNLFFNNGANTIGDVRGGVDVFDDPRFVNPSAGDYHLSAGSPAIDAGFFIGVSIDLDHRPRAGCAVDIGAYEFAEPLNAPNTPGCNPVFLSLIQR